MKNRYDDKLESIFIK